MYAAIRKSSIKPECVEEVTRRLQKEFVFLISQEPGFLDHYALRVGRHDVLTISVFDTRAGAEGTTPLVSAWVHQHLERFVEGIAEATVGQVFAGASAAASHDEHHTERP